MKQSRLVHFSLYTCLKNHILADKLDSWIILAYKNLRDTEDIEKARNVAKNGSGKSIAVKKKKKKKKNKKNLLFDLLIFFFFFFGIAA